MINETDRTKEMMRNKKNMTFALRILAGATDELDLLLVIEHDDPFTSYKYSMSLGDYCLLPVFFLTKSVVSYLDASKQIYV
jgi:hypothetical protein